MQRGALFGGGKCGHGHQFGLTNRFTYSAGRSEAPRGPSRPEFSAGRPNRRRRTSVSCALNPIETVSPSDMPSAYIHPITYITAAVLTFFLVGCGGPAGAHGAQQGAAEAVHPTEDG